MSLKPEGINPVPEETARIAHGAYPKGNVFMHMRDELGTMDEDENFADLFSPTGQPAEAPWRLALVTIMQFAQGLSDRQAADAVRGRIDWKDALGLELDDSGFDASIRSRVPHAIGGRSSRRTAFDGDADALQAARLAEPLAANSARIQRMCWPRFALSIDSDVAAKRCAMGSMVWLS
jgi:transposase